MIFSVSTILAAALVLKPTASQTTDCISSSADDVCMLQIAGRRNDSDEETDRELPVDAQCNRQCRWDYGRNQRNVVGVRRSKIPGWDMMGSWCHCFKRVGKHVQELHNGRLIQRSTEKFFDANTWGGNYTTDLVCVAGKSLWDKAGRTTMTRYEAESANKIVIHCGECAACSDMSDVLILSLTRNWLADVMTQVGAAFASPIFGHFNVSRMQRNLVDLGMNFSMIRPDGLSDRTTCMEAWTDNIQSTIDSCYKTCFIKYMDPSAHYVDINDCSGYIGLDRLRCNCLVCDQKNSGPPFIKAAGADARSTGLWIDMMIPTREICPVGIYSWVNPNTLPTLPMPSADRIAAVLSE